MTSFKIEDLTEELFKNQIMEWDEFSLYVRTHVYLQYYVNKAIEKTLGKNKEIHPRVDFTTSLKLQVLHGMKFLSNVMYENCSIMNSIRNKLAHNLNTEQSVRDQIKNMQMPWLGKNSIENMNHIDIYRHVSFNVIMELKNALEQNRRAMYYPDETEYDKINKKYL